MCDVAILQDGAAPSLRSRRIGWWADALTEKLLRRSSFVLLSLAAWAAISIPVSTAKFGLSLGAPQ